MPCRRVGVRDPSQHGESPTDGVAAGREPLVRQRLPRREDGDALGGRKAPSEAARSSASRVVAVTTTTGAAVGRATWAWLRERGDEERSGAVARGHVDEACATDLVEDVVDIGKRPEGGQQRMRHQARPV